jgi:hypothetical protein
MQDILQRILTISSSIRYVAIYYGGALVSAARPDLANASSSESDKYEELLVNPTLLTLSRQRGNIDCGGLDWLLIRYGAFFEFVAPLDQGHVSVGLEATSDPVSLVPGILAAAAPLKSAHRAV